MSIVGTNNSEDLFGTSGNDLIQGLGGNDALFGYEGNDSLYGGDGNDFLHGGLGNDWLDGGAGNFDWAFFDGAPGGIHVNLVTGQVTGAMGNDTLMGVENVGGTDFNDTLIGDAGNNMLQGRGGDDLMDGGSGYDTIDYFHALGSVVVNLQTGKASGADGADTLMNFEAVYGSAYRDILSGDAGNNSLHGRDGNDILSGGGGDDFLQGDAGNDFIRGGDNGMFGDSVSYSSSTSGVNVNLAAGTASDGMGGTDTLVEIEHVFGTRYADSLIGNGQTNWFRPDAGNDTVDGADGLDVVMYEGASAGVVINLQAGTATGASIGTDSLAFIEAAHGTSFADDITLSNANGYVFGRGGNDILRGGSGSDNLIGGTGQDTLIGGNGHDTASYFDDGYDGAGGVGVTVDLLFGTATDNWGSTDTLSSIEGVSGSQYDDQLYGSASGDSFNGQAGNDLILGRGGNDFFEGGHGNDTMDGGGGNDFFAAGAGNDSMDGGAITDLINYTDLNSINYGSATTGIVMNLQTGVVQDGLGGIDQLANINFVTGSAHADSITGSSGIYFEQFDGGLGNDTIDGGAINASFANANRVNFFNSQTAALVNLAAGTATSGLGNDTLININHIVATRYDDDLRGSDSAIPESFAGRRGSDTIDGAGGIDEVRYNFGFTPVNVNLATGIATGGEGGIDTLSNIEGVRGSSGNDTLVGGNVANDAFEFFMGMGGNDFIDGGTGFDRVDYVSSTDGVTVTLGGMGTGIAQDGLLGTDTLVRIEAVRGSTFDDTLTGSDIATLESFEGRQGNDLIDGRGGVDRADYAGVAGGVVVNLQTGTAASDGYGGTDTLAGIENVRGSSFNDLLTGNALANFLQGNAGNDTLVGGGGDDTLAGGAGNDSLSGGEGNDEFKYEAQGAGLDTISGFATGDTLLVQATVVGPASSGNGSLLLAGQMQALLQSGSTTLYIGTDAVAGADIEIRFDSLITPSRFTVLDSADGYSLIGLTQPARVAEIAVQFKAVGNARADVAGNVEGRSTTNEVAVARVTEALARFAANAGDGDDQGASLADAPGAAGLELLGVTGSMPALDATLS